MIVLIPYINLLNLSWIIKCLFLRNMEPLRMKFRMNKTGSSRKHAYIILTPLTPLLYSKTGVYGGIHYFSYFCSKTYIVGTR